METLTQEQRIAERRARVQKRLAAERGQATVAGHVPLPSLHPCEQRAQQARVEVNQTYNEALHAVTQFSVKADADEAERRDREDDLTNRREASREEVEAVTATKHAAIELCFESLYEHDVPHTLHEAMESQKKECASLVEVKDRLIAELQSQLMQKEEEYVRLLRCNATDVTQLVRVMHDTTDNYISEYTRQLGEVEAAYKQERQEYLEAYAAEIKELIRTRHTKETDCRKRREHRIVEAANKLNEKNETSYEDYNQTKKEHQSDINALRQELEKCKADFMLNGERLSYNLQVLRERVKENKNTQNQYKRKLAKLQDTLSALLARHQESDRKYQRVNRDLTAQLKRVGAQYKDIQKKFQLFEKSDKAKYRQLWNMHDQKCQYLVHRALKADRVVFEEILHMPWSPPDLAFWPEEPEDLEGLEEGENEDDTSEELELSESAMMLFHILKSQASFLVDANVRAAIERIEGTTEEQADVEGILTTLKLTNNEDIRNLLEYFLVENEDDDTVALINPQEALCALKAFLEDREAQLAKEKVRTAKQAAKERDKAKTRLKEAQRAAEREYWNKLTQCVPLDHIHVWDALEKGLEQYLAQLQQRKALIATTDTLRAQNEELKMLIGQYMQSGVNYQLHVPPQLITKANQVS